MLLPLSSAVPYVLGDTALKPGEDLCVTSKFIPEKEIQQFRLSWAEHAAILEAAAQPTPAPKPAQIWGLTSRNTWARYAESSTRSLLTCQPSRGLLSSLGATDDQIAKIQAQPAWLNSSPMRIYTTPEGRFLDALSTTGYTLLPHGIIPVSPTVA